MRQKGTVKRSQSMGNTSVSVETVKAALTRGDMAVAEKQLNKLLKDNPDDLEALYLKGAMAIKSGKPGGAVQPLRSVLNAVPENPIVLNTLGCALFNTNDLAECQELLERAIKISPDYMEAVGNYGLLLQKIGRLDEAMKYLARAAHHPDAAQNVVEAWFREMFFQGKSSETTSYLPNMLKKYPNSMFLNCLNAGLLEDQGQFELAEESWKKAEVVNFRNPHVAITRGARQIAAGDTKGARKNFDKALQLDPLNADALFAWVSAFARYEKDRNTLCRVQGQILESLQRTELAFRDWSQLQFSAGALADALGDKDRAFEHYDQGNRAVWDRYAITNDVYIETGQKIKDAFNFQFFKDKEHIINRKPEGVDQLGEGLIFIGCMPRSGTTLTEQILSRGSRVKAGGERDDIGRMAEASMKGDGRSDRGNISELTLGLAREIASNHQNLVKTQVEDGQMFSDKTPRNFYHFGLLYLLFPRAKFVNCLRNPMDTCLSCYFNYFQWNSVKFSYDLETLGIYYRVYENLMDHWRIILPIDIHDVVYEDLTANPEEEIRKLVSFCGLSWDDVYLATGKGNRVVKTASASQVRQPMYRSSVERWKPYEKHLFPLLNALEADYNEPNK